MESHTILFPEPRLPLTPALCSLKLANEDKEQKLALLEEARVAMGKEAGDLRAGLQEVERSRLEARRELQELRRQVPPLGQEHPLSGARATICKTRGLNGNIGSFEHSPTPWARRGRGAETGSSVVLPASTLSQMKMLDSENARLGRELVELQGRLALGERAEKEGRREALGLRQKLLKGEASLEALRQEVTQWVAGCPEGEGPRSHPETTTQPCPDPIP